MSKEVLIGISCEDLAVVLYSVNIVSLCEKSLRRTE